MKKNTPKELFHSLFENVNGQQISMAARKKLSYFYSGHTYGEVTYEGFSKALEQVDPKEGDIFYDLGSGVGKAVILSSLLYDFSKLIGVEIIRELNDAALTVHRDLKKHVEEDEKLRPRVESIQFLNSDFSDVDFSNANVVFINATCLEYELHGNFMNKVNSLEPGTRIITNTFTLASPLYKVTYEGIHPFSWGDDIVYVQERLDDFGYFSSRK